MKVIAERKDFKRLEKFLKESDKDKNVSSVLLYDDNRRIPYENFVIIEKKKKKLRSMS